MICKVCGADDLGPLPFDFRGWQRCASCGSDSNPLHYADVSHAYAGTIMQDHLRASCADLKGDQATNLDWFGRHSPPERTFLDIGCCTGAGMEGMRDRGYQAWGFDVSDAAVGPGVVVAPEFRASLLDRRFGCILIREVIEHIEDWRELLRQAVCTLVSGGLLQIQTPRPGWDPNPIPYQDYHLQLFSPVALRLAIRDAGLTIVDRMQWPCGQAFLCRLPTIL